MNENIYIVDKPSGMTSKDFADLVKLKNNLKKICFCGRLDPMARGKMLLLGNDMCKKMNDYLKTEKTYQFEICLGYLTDSDDPLGIIMKQNNNFDEKEIFIKIINYIDNMETDLNQEFHKFSSIRVNGKPAWLHSMEKTDFKKPKHNVSIKSKKLIGKNSRDLEFFTNNIINTINKINKKHTFRQEEIIDQWKNICKSKSKFSPIYSLKYEFTVTSGFYVRQFIRDQSNYINFPLMVYDINRTKILYK